jgi:hypothetical protein
MTMRFRMPASGRQTPTGYGQFLIRRCGCATLIGVNSGDFFPRFPGYLGAQGMIGTVLIELAGEPLMIFELIAT